MKISLMLVLAGISIVLPSCSTPDSRIKEDQRKKLRVTTTTYHNIPTNKPNASVVILPNTADLINSIEYKFYSSTISNILVGFGFQVAPLHTTPDWVIVYEFIQFPPTKSSIESPNYALDPGTTTYHSGSLSGTKGYGSYSGYSQTMPTLRRSGFRTVDRYIYGWRLRFLIYDGVDFKNGQFQEKCDIRAVAIGDNFDSSLIIDSLTKESFKSFPNPNGSKAHSVFYP